MQQRVPCPRCGVPVEYGSRFCSNCGNTLQWGAPPPPYGYQQPYSPPNPSPGRPQPWGQQPPPYGQQPGWNQPPPHSQASGWGGPPPPQQQPSTRGYHGAMPQQKSSTGSILLLVIVIVIIFTVGGIALATNGFSSSKPASDTTSSTVPTKPAETPPASAPAPSPAPSPEPTPPPAPAWPTSDAPAVTATELISAYVADSISASSKYQGNVYAISGTVVGVNSSSPPFLYLGDAAAGAVEIQCGFSQGQEATVSSFDVGQNVKVEGRIISFNRSILVVDHCRFVQ